MKRRTAAVDRRTVLGAALAGGAGVAAARLLGLRRVIEIDPPQLTAQAAATKNGLDWVSPLTDERSRVAHLLRRATLGYTAAELETAASEGYARTVDRLIDTPPAEPPALTGADTATQTQPLRIDQLRTWWADWALKTPTPFAEKMTVFWHGHFTSDFRKVGLQSPFVYWQDLTWRKLFLRDLRSILYDVTVDPAMLRYLDLAQSSAKEPNENFARELMELFTLGSGSFSEDDVKAAAKALTGWREPRTAAMVDAQIKEAQAKGNPLPRNLPVADTVKTGVFERQRAYSGPDFTFLGVTRRWDTSGILDQIAAHPATATYITRKVVDGFIGPNVEEQAVARFADGFRKSALSMKALMRSVFTSAEFTSPQAYRSLVRSPIELGIATAKALELPALSKLIVSSTEGMGQALFDPPSVGGWPDGAGWISSSAMLARINFVTAAVNQQRKPPAAARAHVTWLDSTLSPASIAILEKATDDRARWTALLCCPEFQLK